MVTKIRWGASVAMAGCLLAFGAQAQEADTGQLQFLLEQGQLLESCLRELDPATVTRYRSEGEEVAEQVRALCTAGRTDEARATALAFGRKLADSPLAGEVERCGPAMQLVAPALIALATRDDSNVDVCAMP